jgi:hypothetical protein
VAASGADPAELSVGRSIRFRSLDLFSSWKVWAERGDHFFGDAKTFRDRLDGRNGIRIEPEQTF